MADWWIRFLDRAQENTVGEYSLMQTEVEVRNSEVGGFSGELALAQKRRNQHPLTGLGITRDQFAPYRTNYEIWRQSSGAGMCISDGMLTSVNLNFNRDTILIAGRDWKHYLQRRIYPFNPIDYVTFNDGAPEAFWDQWPKRWPDSEADDPVDIAIIIRDLLASMKTGKPIDINSSDAARNGARALGVPPITWSIPLTEITTKHKIYPGDSTTIYDHIQKFSEMNFENGFEWDILPLSMEFKLWSPRKYLNQIPGIYEFVPTELEDTGALTDFDWTNEGPDGTYLIGLGSGKHKVGAKWEDVQTTERFGRLDLVYDYGEMQYPDTILQRLKDQNDLWPQKRLNLAILNPEFATPNFYTGGRPRALIADTVWVRHFFSPYHTVSAFFQVNAIKWQVDGSTNENVVLDLMMHYEPETGTSGGHSDAQ